MNSHQGEILRYILLQQGIDLIILSDKLKVDITTLQFWLKSPTLARGIIEKIGCAINFDFSYFFYHSDVVPNPIIYLIDDTDLDIEIFKISMRKVIQPKVIEVFKTGDDAINKLLNVSINAPRSLPDYIFVDLNMPVCDGWDFLSHYYQLDLSSYKKPLIYILSSSINKSDINKSTNNKLIKEFISKPIEVRKMKTIFGVS